MTKKITGVMLVLAIMVLFLSACGKPSKEECGEMLANGKFTKFQDEGCGEYMVEELENLFGN